MAIKTVKATIKGQDYTLTLNPETSKYEAVVTAPADSSFNEEGGYFPVTIKADDTAGNSTTVTTATAELGENLKLYVKEKIKPVIALVSPSANAYVTTGTPTIKFTVSDNGTQTSGFSGVNKSTCVLKVNGTAAEGVTYTESAEGKHAVLTGTYTPTKALADGTVNIEITCSDNDGNAADKFTASFKVDTVAPSLTVTAPTDNFETNKAALTVTGTTDDTTSKPVTIKITLNGADQGAVTVQENGAFTKELTLSKQGDNTIVVTATDKAGKSTSVTRKVIYNTTAPKITAVSITPNPVDAGKTYTISVTVA